MEALAPEAVMRACEAASRHLRSFQIALDSTGRPAKVEFDISSENLIYITSKKLSMYLVSGRVVSYTISGSQALRWFSSPTRYSVSGVVL